MSTSLKGTILVVEDELAFRRVYEDLLKSDGYNVLVAEDGEKGWELAYKELPDLIVLDLALPKLHGLDVLKNIRSSGVTKSIPVIVMTVLGEQDDIRKGFELGANDYLVKGYYTPGEMLNKIRLMLSESDIRKGIGSYKVAVKERKLDSAKLEHDIGLTNLFSCPSCGGELALELIPDYTRTQGHWFSAHFLCPACERLF
jgi:DNA-binding response OmpR family regulator